jgi:hypothetical protein
MCGGILRSYRHNTIPTNVSPQMGGLGVVDLKVWRSDKESIEDGQEKSSVNEANSLQGDRRPVTAIRYDNLQALLRLVRW